MANKKTILPRLIVGKSFEDKNLTDLELMERVLYYGSIGKPLPDWLINRLFERVKPILGGQEKDFRNWTVDHTAMQREKMAKKESIVIYEVVEELSRTKKYHTDIEREGNVYEAAAEKIAAEKELILSKFSIKNTHMKMRKIYKMLEDS